MRLTGLLLGATAMMATLTSSYAEDIAPEKVTSATIPADAKRLYLIDLTINHIADGKAWVIDADKLSMLGTIELGFLGTFYEPPKSDKLYVASTFYERLTRGKRTDVISIFDRSTLKVVDEIVIPTKRAMPIEYRPLLQGSSDGKFLFVQNATPATSITVTNLAKKTSAELPAPGCYGTYPSIKDAKRVSTLCGDGTFGTYTLNDAGTEGKRLASDKFFDADEDALFIHGETLDENYYYASFKGVLHSYNLDGDKAKQVDKFSLTEGVEGNWRPGGYQPYAIDHATGILYILMHSNGAEGSHKNPSEEIWSVDLKAKKVVARTKSPPLISLTIAQGDKPTLYGINPLEPSVVKFTVNADHGLAEAGSLKVGETATQIEVGH
jgi:methylamine dehydrogenase heavy chain